MNSRETLIIVLLFMVVSTVSSAFAQQKKEILDDLNRYVPGKGRVTVYEDERIAHVLGRRIGPTVSICTSSDGAEHYYKTKGYKIQAFSGNRQRTSKEEAEQKKRLIEDTYPELETIVLFDSPFWRVRVGNFLTRAEAEEVMRDMKKKFPTIGKEMYVVSDEIKIRVAEPEK